MKSEEYPKECAVTESRKSEIYLDGACQTRFLHAVLGLTTETGELTDLLKKWLFYGRRFSVDQVVEELGDLLWYTGILMDELGITPEEVMAANIAKLRERYPQSFDEDQANSRDLAAESQALLESTMSLKDTLDRLNFFGEERPLTRRSPLE